MLLWRLDIFEERLEVFAFSRRYQVGTWNLSFRAKEIGRE
jgi:hypothetical protein